MISTLAKKCRRTSRSSLTGDPCSSFKPSVEALESRSLLDASSFVGSLYTNILQRPPSQTELNAWVSQIQSGMPLQAVSAAIVASTEYRETVVRNDYTDLFGRPVDPQGLNYWTQQLANGMTQDQVKASLLSSEEFLMTHGSTMDQFIEGAYETVLHRSADPAGFAYWKQQLSFQTRHQVTLQDAASRIVGSDEAHRQEVDTLFAELLHRSPDDSGAAAWASFLDNGGSQSQVTEAIVNSPEYLNDTGAIQTAPITR